MNSNTIDRPRLSGFRGLLLAPPSGYQTAMFPPERLVVAAAYLTGWCTIPWIFLGSPAANLLVGGDDFILIFIASAVFVALAPPMDTRST